VQQCLGSGFTLLRTHRDFGVAITKLWQQAGDADTNGAVAGALLGCYLGYKNIPQKWIEGLVHREWLEQQVETLLKTLYP